MQSVKCMAVGDTDTGKSYLIFTYIKKIFPKEYIPSIYDSYSTQVSVDSRTVNLEIRDSSGSEVYDSFRTLCYPGVDIFIVCFSVTNPASFDNVRDKWLPEIKHHCPDVPFVLVGTKTDLREDQQVLENLRKQNLNVITQQQGKMLAREIKAVKYVECAAKTQNGLNEVFDESARAFLEQAAITKNPCVLL